MVGLSRALANAAMMLASCAVTTLALEGAVRLFYTPTPREIDFFSLHTSAYYQVDETVGWRPRPNTSGRHVSPGSFDTTFTTNSRGLRDREHSFEKPPGIRRVVVLGDSFAWGYGVNDDAVFPRVLEPQLPAVEVINLGVNAYGLRQEFAYLRLEGMRYKPDLVILALCMNDLPPDRPERESTQSQGHNGNGPETLRGDLRANHGLFPRLKQFLASHSALYSFVSSRVNTNGSLVRLLVRLGLKGQLARLEDLDLNLMPAIRRHSPELEVGFVQAEDQLRMMRDYLRSANVGFLVALIPSLQAVDRRSFAHSIASSEFTPEDFDLEGPYRRLLALGEAEGIPMVHPLPLFRERHAAGQQLYIPRDMHFTPEGHRLFAAALVNPIRTILEGHPSGSQRRGRAPGVPLSPGHL